MPSLFGKTMGNLLTKLQAKVLTDFFNTPLGKSYFLTGGTALSAFYFEHRESLDLDLFTLEDIKLPVVLQIFRQTAQKTHTKLTHQVATENYHEFYFTSKHESLKVDIVKDIPVHFGKIKSFDSVRVDSIDNIGSNKICAILGRTEAKDFIDLYFILENGFSFEKLLKEAKQKDVGLTEFYLANMLLQVKTLRNFPKMLKIFDKEKMEKYFVKLANNLLLSIKPER